MTLPTTAALRMTGGRVRLDGQGVLRGIDLTVTSGEALALLGPNGFGHVDLPFHYFRSLSPPTRLHGTRGTSVPGWRR